MSLTALGPDHIAASLYRYDNVHRPLASPAELTDAHVKQYHEQGFVAIENVFSPDEVATYQRAISDLIAEGNPKIVSFEKEAVGKQLTPEQREGYVRKCWQFVNHEPRLMAMSLHPVLNSVITRLLGEPASLVQDMALLKPPHIGREKPWHQDMAYFKYSPPEKVIGTWTALDPATVENGCMHMIPRSHLAGPKPHYHDRDCQLSDEDVAVNDDVVVPLSPGGVLFFSGLIHHGTPPNRSANRRRAVQLHYAGASCKPISPEEHLGMFHDAAGYVGCAAFSARPITGKLKDI